MRGSCVPQSNWPALLNKLSRSTSANWEIWDANFPGPFQPATSSSSTDHPALPLTCRATRLTKYSHISTKTDFLPIEAGRTNIQRPRVTFSKLPAHYPVAASELARLPWLSPLQAFRHLLRSRTPEHWRLFPTLYPRSQGTFQSEGTGDN
jgi:hypothetical protein